MWIDLGVCSPIVRNPLGLILRRSLAHISTGINMANLEEPERFDVVRLIQGEPMVNASRKDDKVAGLNGEADPRIAGCFCQN